MSRWLTGAALAAIVLGGAPALAQTSPQPAGPLAAPADARLYFIAPTNGARIRGPFVVQFGLRNMGVTQAGSNAPNAGHHHLLIDVKDPVAAEGPLPADRNHLHFGGGQTETRVDLPPGRHTLQLVLGDANHQPFKPVIASQKIEVTVLSAQAPKKKRKKRRS